MLRYIDLSVMLLSYVDLSVMLLSYVELRLIFKKISKFPQSRSASLRFALRDCGNRSEFAKQIPTLFEISCADIAQHISFLGHTGAARSGQLSVCI